MRITVFFRKTFRFMQFHPRPFHYMGTRVENSTRVPLVSRPTRPLRGLKAVEDESEYLEF